MKKFAIHTLGCKTNQLESTMISQLLLDNSYEQVGFDEIADFYIINSCTVTNNADSDTLYYIRRAKNHNPDAKIILTGCYAQLNPSCVGADVVLGNNHKFEILNYLNSTIVAVDDIMSVKEFCDPKVFVNQGRTRANIKIQDGCNNRCSYCTIPYARGNSRSNSVENIISEINSYIKNDYKEIVFTGIHIGQWGRDFEEKQTLLDLLKQIEKIPNLPRYRLGSLEPPEITDEMIDFLSKSEKFAHHLHISLQNANDEILSLMKRKYTSKQVLDIMTKLKNKMPDISLGCDIIAGFPTETDEQFENCLLNIKAMPFSYMHVFPYSIRKGTPAALMEQVDEETKKMRAKKLRQVALEKKQEYLQSFLGKELEVLVEKSFSKDGFLKGTSSNYISVITNYKDGMQNQIKKIVPSKIEGTSLRVIK